MNDPESEKSSVFKDRHNACKAALAHIELLVKLAGLVEVTDAKRVDDIIQMLEAAQGEINETDDRTE